MDGIEKGGGADVMEMNNQRAADILRNANLGGVLRQAADYAIEKLSADVAPVVRCKDCKHYEMGACLKIYSDGAVSQYAWQERKPDDFCSYGERKDGERQCS